MQENVFRKKGFLGRLRRRACGGIDGSVQLIHEVKAILPGTGGYGTTRIIDKLDYDVIRRNPKILVGFSDITGIACCDQSKNWARDVSFASAGVGD